jgi:hypothetical protein
LPAVTFAAQCLLALGFPAWLVEGIKKKRRKDEAKEKLVAFFKRLPS